MVNIYDLETGKVTAIPAEELAPGMVCVTLTDREGEFWVDASKLKASAYRHPPFSEEVRVHLRQIEQALREVYPLSLEEWEDGFRRDTNPDREIAAWLYLSNVYSNLVVDRPLSPESRKDIFRILVSCLNNPRGQALTVVELQVLSRPEAEAVVRAFFKS